MEKYCTARQVADDNVAHAHCMLDTQGYKPTLIICDYVKIMCNMYYFSTARMVTPARVNITFYLHCLSCFNVLFTVTLNFDNI